MKILIKYFCPITWEITQHVLFYVPDFKMQLIIVFTFQKLVFLFFLQIYYVLKFSVIINDISFILHSWATDYNIKL